MLQCQCTICLSTVKIIGKKQEVCGIITGMNLITFLLIPYVGNSPPTVNYNVEPIPNSASFKYKTSITGKTSDANH